jgi:hypothetical protein
MCLAHLALLPLPLPLPQGMSEEEVAAEMAPGPDDPQPLSAEEEEERQALMREGFSGWNRCGLWLHVLHDASHRELLIWGADAAVRW